ncbi:MAG TPA: protein kinase [Candidatus Cottocaccamicrobium excrementipullorum]|nr:protein kinase [Candidatus Cottocaccamicrobium excrementipullorum]
MERCPNCFAPGYQQGGCSRCGFQAAYDKRSPRVLPAGTVLAGRYYLGRLLGEGGFGITYKAWDLKTSVLCAVKEYAPNGITWRGADKRRLVLGKSEDEKPYQAGLHRFMEEAQILSRLEQIPSVVDITYSFQENNTAYFVMEFLDGADLKQIVKASKGRLPVEEVTDIILQVALSMDVIHTKTKIIHRDISPDNIYITRDKKVKLIDFGSAKQTITGAAGGLSVLVKPGFAPPEQFSSQMVQGSYTDVYALAATYYYALTGQMIPTAQERLAGANYVPLKQMNLGILESVSDAVDQALALNISQRTQTMQAFIRGIAPAAGRRQQVRRKTAFVRVVKGPEAGLHWTLVPGQEVTIGRSDTEAQLRLRQPEDVSRVHCRITWMPERGKFRIQDLSTYGTYYQGRRLNKGVLYEVSPPARLMLASAVCVIELGVREENQ